MGGEPIVVALGGNALIRANEHGTLEEQERNARQSLAPIARIIPNSRVRSTTPAATSCRSRLESSAGEMAGTPRWISENRVLPHMSSRRTSGIQRSHSSSAVFATGQNWP